MEVQLNLVAILTTEQTIVANDGTLLLIHFIYNIKPFVHAVSLHAKLCIR
jgi:hypothetical protein